jgi:hypothetical protein
LVDEKLSSLEYPSSLSILSLQSFDWSIAASSTNSTLSSSPRVLAAILPVVLALLSGGIIGVVDFKGTATAPTLCTLFTGAFSFPIVVGVITVLRDDDLTPLEEPVVDDRFCRCMTCDSGDLTVSITAADDEDEDTVGADDTTIDDSPRGRPLSTVRNIKYLIVESKQ